jgi:hypothetical protein
MRRRRGLTATVSLWAALALGAGFVTADEYVPALRLIQATDGSMVFIGTEGEVVGTGADAGPVPETIAATPPQLPGWPLRLGEVDSTPIVGDIDGDGDLEVALASFDGNLYVVRADGSLEAGWPHPMGRGTGQTPSLADIDGDGRLEVFMSTLSDVLGIAHDGSAIPGWPYPGSGFSTTGIDDLDGDGRYEIVAMDRSGHAHALDPGGLLLPGWPFTFADTYARSNVGPALGDVDGDGTAEVAIPLAASPSLWVFSLSGTVLPEFPLLLTQDGLKSGVSMADINGGGGQELIFHDVAGVWVVDGDGSVLPGFPGPQFLAGSRAPAVGDIDGDGHLELAFGGRGGNGRVHVFRHDGSLQPGWPVTVPAFSFNSQVTLGDVDGDGGVDIVVGGFTTGFSTVGRIYAWHADGTPVRGFPFALPEGKAILASSVTITDLDQDGDVDLLVGAITGIGGTSDGRVFAFDLGARYDPTTMEWPTFGHDVRHTSRYEPPDRRPHAVVSVEPTIECTSLAGALVTLDGSFSEDSDSTPGTNDDLVSFEWFQGFGLPTQVLLGTGGVVTVSLPLGSHEITLRVKDRAGASDTATATVEVVDTTPPGLSVSVTPGALWPPNHRMVPVEVAIQAADLCGQTEAVLLSVVSNEPDDAVGAEDGGTTEDIQGAEIGTPDLAFELRAERSGAGDGRLYGVAYRATDAAGNGTEATGEVLVPHDQGDGATEPLRLSVTETATGTLVEWGPVPGAISYSVLRGDVGSIHDDGAAFDLGPTRCVAAGIAQPNTVGYEDPDQPEAREAFFYVAEYDDGHPSAYGSEDAAKPRSTTATGGECP